MPDDDTLRELAELEAGATPGPWVQSEPLSEDEDTAWAVLAWDAASEDHIIVATTLGAVDHGMVVDATNREADAALIVWLRNNAPGLIERLSGENERLTAALELIAEMSSGAIPGHAVATGCRHNMVAYKALHAPDERQCPLCDGRGYTMDFGPWKTNGLFNTAEFVQYDERAERGDPVAISVGKRIDCSCDDGWVHKSRLAAHREAEGT